MKRRFRPGRSAVEGAFGWVGADYAMLIKLYGHAPDGQRRYNPPEIIGIDKNRVSRHYNDSPFLRGCTSKKLVPIRRQRRN